MNTNNNYKIEKNVPLPHLKRGNKWAELAREMEAGDSVVVHSRLEAMNLRAAIVRTGFKCVTRNNDTPTPRVWKVNK